MILLKVDIIYLCYNNVFKILSYNMYNMDQFNLLDLNNDVLNIIGDYVKKDNHRIFNEKLKQDMLNYVDIEMKIETNKKRKILLK